MTILDDWRQQSRSAARVAGCQLRQPAELCIRQPTHVSDCDLDGWASNGVPLGPTLASTRGMSDGSRPFPSRHPTFGIPNMAATARRLATLAVTHLNLPS